MTEKIRSHLATVAYREGWDRIFGKKQTCLTCAYHDYYGCCRSAQFIPTDDDDSCGHYERKTNND